MLENTELQSLLEAIILAAEKPMSFDALLKIFDENEKPSKAALSEALKNLQENDENRGIRLVEVASGFQFQVKPEFNNWVVKLHEEKAPRYSRALFETLALIAYRQPITRGEIEDIRGVSLSTSIFKTLQEDREWIRIVGHREVPGRPALYATTKAFLDYFGLKTLEELPSLPEVMNLETIAADNGLFLPESPEALSVPLQIGEQGDQNQTDIEEFNEQSLSDETDETDEADETLVTISEEAEELDEEEILEISSEEDTMFEEDIDSNLDLNATSKDSLLDELFGDNLEDSLEEEQEFLDEAEEALEPTFEIDNLDEMDEEDLNEPEVSTISDDTE